MVPVTDQEINALIGFFIWPFARIAGILMTEPFFSTRAIPRRFKAGFAVMLTVLVAPLLPKMDAIPLVSGEGILVLATQILIGTTMGFVMRIAMAAVEMAGFLVGNQMGLGFAMSFDPVHAAQVPVVSRLQTLFVTLIFLSLDVHQVVISTLVQSFDVIPVGHAIPHASWRHLADWGGHVISWGLWLSLPILAVLLIVNLAIGVMTRAAPQFNVFSFGFPLTIGIGFMALYITLPMMIAPLEEMWQLSVEFMLAVWKSAPR